MTPDPNPLRRQPVGPLRKPSAAELGALLLDFVDALYTTPPYMRYLDQREVTHDERPHSSH